MNILLLETIDDEAHALLAEVAPVILAEDPADPGEGLDYGKIHAIVTRGLGQVSAALIARCPNLKTIARCGAGLNNIDLAAAEAADIPVVFAPGSNSAAVAEHTLMFILALVRGLVPSNEAVHNADWPFRNTFEGDDIGGKTLGIVGLGAVGRRVAGLAEAFGMKVIAFDPFADTGEIESAPLNDFLLRADVVTLHVPLSEETLGLIGADEIKRFKPGAMLINTARGELVDQAAIVAALKDGRLGGYAADVMAQEPPAPDDALANHPKALLTPHLASLTAATYGAMCLRAARGVVAILRNQQPEPGDIYRRRV